MLIFYVIREYYKPVTEKNAQPETKQEISSQPKKTKYRPNIYR